MYAGFLGIVPLVWCLEVCQHLDGPGQDTDQQQRHQEANPDRQRKQRVAVPVSAEPTENTVRGERNVMTELSLT